MDEVQVKLKPNPEKNANFFSRMFFCFISPFLRLGYKRTLETTDLYEVLPADESSLLCDKLEKAWNAEIISSKEKNRKPQLKRAVVAVFGRKFGLAGVVTILEELVKLAQAVFMGGLIRYFRFQSTVTTEEAYGYAIGLTLCAVALAVVHHPYFYYLQRIGMRIRISCSALLYKKSLSLSNASLKKVTVGKIVNMLSNDVARFDQAVLFLHYVWAAPLSLIGFVILLWLIMGPSCLAGFFCLLLLVPLQGVIGRQMGKYRREVATQADKRIGIMNEILNGIRVIKMYAWEQPFSQLVDKARMAEIKKLRVQAFFQGLIMGLFFVSGKLIVLFAIVAYVLSGRAVNAEVIFVASALFNAARLTVTLFLPFAIQFLAETKVTFGRMEEFLLLEDKHLPSLQAPQAFSGIAVGTEDQLPFIDDKIDETKRSMRNLALTGVKGNKPPPLAIRSGENAFVEMVDYCAKWDEDQVALTLDKINFSVKPGQLTVIVGPVGAGKSSILLSLLGETKQVEGRISLQGSVAYVPQEAWIFSATLRRNVTFGVENLDMIRYQQALSVCALKKDVEAMPNGDMTVIGDKGVGLSGGQKARVNLARAVYSDADIYLLDDPLSAVDSTVGRYIFERCILGHLRDKPRLLVTHQLQYLPSADNILVVKGGKVVASGTFKELQNLGDEFTAILQECEDSYKRRESISSPTSTTQHHRQSSHPHGKISSRQNSVQQPASPTGNISPTTSSPKPGVDSLPKLDFRSPGKEESEITANNHSGTDFESYRKAISKMNQDTTKENPEAEKLLKSGESELEQLKEEDEEVKSFTQSLWSLEGAEATLPQQEEDRSTGAVNWRVYYEYFSAMANFCVVMMLLLFCFFVQALFNFSDWWLNIWTTQAEYEDRLKRTMSNETSALSTISPSTQVANLTAPTFWIPGIDKLTSDDCLKIYSGLVVALLLLSLVRSLIFRHMLTRSSFTLHSRMFRAVIRTPIIFFDRNPIGRILNRFSKDTGTMDELLAFVTFDFIQGLISFFGIILVVCLINPWIFVPTVPLLIAFVAVRYYYMKTARSVKRMEATTRSPIFSHVSATLNGLTTIRAFGAASYVIGDFHRYQNIHSAAFSIFLSSSRWFAIFIDWLCASFIGVVAFVSVFSSADLGPGSVGLSLLYGISMTHALAHFVNQVSTMESSMVCVERILEYSRLPPENGLDLAEKHKSDWPGKLPSSWPEKGEIVFDHVSLKYSEDGGNVLHDINFVIKPAEKIGIVGRTGAGKSSLLNALFRLSEPTGTISIDGRDIKMVDLRDLRKRISIIPQDPVLFIGTLRENLDPFNEFSDYEIWTALEQVELKGAVNEMPKKLSSSMQEGGANLSIGQRQLVCLARALLRRNKILVIDEATANVDLHTDALIQRTLRQQFRDCTVLTIAHRLNTIMDVNRVMVLQDGRILELDAPANLLRNADSSFSKLVQETGRANAQMLTTLAEEAYANNGKVKGEEEDQKKK